MTGTVRSYPGDVCPPPEKRGLKEPEAAAYVGVGLTLFREMVADGRMPHPKRINKRVVWDRRKLDLYFDRLPDEEDNRTEAGTDEWEFQA